MAKETQVTVVSNEMPTMMDWMVTINRTIQEIEAGTKTPQVANAIHNQMGVGIRLMKLELEAAKMFNRTPIMLRKLLPPIEEEKEEQ